MERVIEAAHEIFSRPVLFLDEYFHLVNMSPEAPVGIPLWDTLYEKKALSSDQKAALLGELEPEPGEGQWTGGVRQERATAMPPPGLKTRWGWLLRR